eukprot:5675-Chlamydomonas_euryale.AAC.1
MSPLAGCRLIRVQASAPLLCCTIRVTHMNVLQLQQTKEAVAGLASRRAHELAAVLSARCTKPRHNTRVTHS